MSPPPVYSVLTPVRLKKGTMPKAPGSSDGWRGWRKGCEFSFSGSSVHERSQWRVCLGAIRIHLHLFLFCFFLTCVQTCDSMTLLMKKLDHLNDGNQEVQTAASCCSHTAGADEEQQSNTVSFHSGFVPWCFTSVKETSCLCA